MKREIRIIRNAQIRTKADGKGIEGYAAVFNQPSEDLGGFTEKVAPGAFGRHLATAPDVRCLFNHDANVVLGRTKSNTLHLAEDNIGLHFDCDFPDTQAACDLRESIQRGDIDQCSFSFRVNKQTWEDVKTVDGKASTTRTLDDVDLQDVSPVTFPAYPQTSVSARSLWPDGVPEEVAEHRSDDPAGDPDEQACECDCRACFDAECEECPMHQSRCDARFCRCAEGKRAKEESKKTKRVDGEDLSSVAFLEVGAPDDPSTWHLPVKFSTEEKTKAHLSNALVRFNQTKGVPAEKKEAAWKMLVALCKEAGIHVASEEDSLPDDFTENARARLAVMLSL